MRKAGISVDSIIAAGTLPFKVDKVWTMKLPENDLIIFSLLDVSLTAVFSIDPQNGAIK